MLKIISLLLPLIVTTYGAVLLILTSKSEFKNRLYLGLFFANSAILFLTHFLVFNKFWNIFKYIDFIFLSALLAFYPLFYLYIKSAYNFNIIKTKKWIYHFIPSITVGLLMLSATVFSTNESYFEYMNFNLYNQHTTNQNSLLLFGIYKGARIFHLAQILFYGFITLLFLIKANKKVNDSFSNLDKYQERYFFITTISFLILMAIPGFYVTLIGRFTFEENTTLLFINASFFTLLYIILSIIGLLQNPVKIKSIPVIDILNHFSENNDLYELEIQLKNYFENENPWLDPDLNIWDVAKNIGTNRTYVSKIINESCQCNFNEFVNNYRIEKAKQLLKKLPEITIHEVSESSGFGSVNSFLRIFKKHEKCTPTEFRKK